MPDAIAALLSFGLLGVGCIAVVGKFIPVVPSYVLLLFLGMTTSDRGTLALTIMVTTIGSTVGALGWYGLGRALGQQRIDALVIRFGRYVFLNESLYRRMTGAYRRAPFRVTLIGQTIPCARIYIGMPAGVLGLEPRAFLAATMLGTLAWNAPFLSLGYALRGSGHDPVSVGAWAAAMLIAAEFVIVWALRSAAKSGITPPARASA
ncbi:DedA family protein [Dokdonella soli]